PYPPLLRLLAAGAYAIWNSPQKWIEEGDNMVIGRWWIAIGSLVVAGLATGVSAQAQPVREDSVRAVQAVLERQVADWNRGDLDAFLGGYWNSPKVVFQSGGQRFDGWEAMRERYRRRYRAEGRAMGRLEFSALD